LRSAAVCAVRFIWGTHGEDSGVACMRCACSG
jgi:hypothetical protein